MGKKLKKQKTIRTPKLSVTAEQTGREAQLHKQRVQHCRRLLIVCALRGMAHIAGFLNISARRRRFAELMDGRLPLPLFFLLFFFSL